MSVWIKNHRCHVDGRVVEFIGSPYTSGAFPSTPGIAVIHFTYGSSARSSANWFRDPTNPGSSAHVVIDRDGTIIQCVPFDTVAQHAGRSQWRSITGLNRHSFGIELANWGYLNQSQGGWTSHTGVRIAEPILAQHKNGNPGRMGDGPIGWEPYPEPQFEMALHVTRALIEAYGISEIVGHDDISPGRKWDPGPAFDMERFRARIFGDRSSDLPNRYQVSVAEGLNLRSGPGIDHPVIELLPVGTILEPLETSSHWMLVTVLDSGLQPRRTGWVHTAYIDVV